MKDEWVIVIIFFLLSSFSWLMAYFIYLRIGYLKRNLTERVTGISLGQEKFNNGDTNGDTRGVGVTTNFEFMIKDKIYYKKIQVYKTNYLFRIPVGVSYLELPVGTEVQLLYNPNNVFQVIVELNNFKAHRVMILFFCIFASVLSIFTILFFFQ